MSLIVRSPYALIVGTEWSYDMTTIKERLHNYSQWVLNDKAGSIHSFTSAGTQNAALAISKPWDMALEVLKHVGWRHFEHTDEG